MTAGRRRLIRAILEYFRYVKTDEHICIMGNPFCECPVGVYCQLMPDFRPSRRRKSTTDRGGNPETPE